MERLQAPPAETPTTRVTDLDSTRSTRVSTITLVKCGPAHSVREDWGDDVAMEQRRASGVCARDMTARPEAGDGGIYAPPLDARNTSPERRSLRLAVGDDGMGQ
jgi:hypothetical protein